MGVLFQLVLFAVRWAERRWGHPGAFVSAGILGLTDVDALVAAMTKDTGAQLPVGVAARAIMIGVLSNTLLKLSIGVFVGSQPFRRIVVVGLSVIAIASGLALAYFG